MVESVICLTKLITSQLLDIRGNAGTYYLREAVCRPRRGTGHRATGVGASAL